MVAELAGSIESFVLTTEGSLRYLSSELPLSAVTCVITGRVARRTGLGCRLLARAIARDAAEGAAVTALGAFDQGYYDALGYGNGSYVVRAHFDPAQLKVVVRPRIPERLGAEHWREMHAARLRRHARHGRCNLFPPAMSRYDGLDPDRYFGLGYREEPGGELTHFLWCHVSSAETGPYHVELVYRTGEELLELLALVKSLSDQVVEVKMTEPPGVMLQDLLERPWRHVALTRGGKHEVRFTATASWQFRILDLTQCIEATHVPCGHTAFNLVLTDPLADLEPETGWRGIGGRYVVRLGPESSCREGTEVRLPVLEASVGAFSRLWLGVLPATGLAVAGEVHGPEGLLRQLDELLRLPTPQPDWEF